MRRTSYLLIALSAFLVACAESNVASIVTPTPTPRSIPSPKWPLKVVDISKMPALSSKGRIQDGDTARGEPNQIAVDLVANGKDSIPFLIDQLENETEMDRGIISFWYTLYVGDLAHIILTDLFTDETEMTSTIPGFGWDEFLERGKDRDLMGEEVLRRYIRKHGRKEIKRRWQEMWDAHKEKIFWDESCRCFKVGQ